MTKETLLIAFRFIILVLTQVLVLNKIYLFGYLNPTIYLLFIFLYPLRKERGNFILLSFLLGLSIDFFSNSGGINAAASVCIAYLRLPILKLVLNKSDLDFKLFKLINEHLIKVILFISILTFIHHLIIFSLEYFNWNDLLTIIFNTITTSIFTIFLSTLSLLFFSKNNLK